MLSLIHDRLYPIRIVKGSKMIPIGRTHYGKVVYLHLGKLPHTKIAGLTSMGKTACITTIIYYLCNQLSPEQCRITIIDLKGSSYSAWKNIAHIKGIYVTTSQARKALTDAVNMMRERLTQIDDDRAHFRESREFPLEVILIDEGGELSPADAIGDDKAEREACMKALSTLVRVGREPGIRVIYGTQRPDVHTLPMTVRSQLDNTICFRVREKGDSNIVLGNEKGKDLIVNPGRAIFQSGVIETEFQAIYIPEDKLNAWLKANTNMQVRSGGLDTTSSTIDNPELVPR